MLLPAPAFVQKLDQKEVMADFESTIKKNIKCQKHPRIIGVLKKLVRATIITKRILELKVNLTVAKLLTSALVTEKKFIKTIIKDEVIQF